jgi:hypothetical protein
MAEVALKFKNAGLDVQISKYRGCRSPTLELGGTGGVGAALRPNIVRVFFVSVKLVFRGTF